MSCSETDKVSRLTRWSRKIEDWTANNDKRIYPYGGDEQAEGHQSTDDEQPQINPLLAGQLNTLQTLAINIFNS